MTGNIAHRGASGLEPENTLRSFRRAGNEGADALELDLRLTGDGHLVVLHDTTVDRTTDGTGPVHEMSLARLRRLDAGLGEKVPTFEEVLESTALPIHAELKVAEAAEPLADSLRGKEAAARVTAISFDSEALGRLRAALPDLAVGMILRAAPPEAVGRVSSVGAEFVSLKADRLDAEAVERCRRAGFGVTTWTVNEPEGMRQTMELGVDGIATDRPDLLAGVIARGAHGPLG